MHLFLVNLWERKMPKAEARRVAQIAMLHCGGDPAPGDTGKKNVADDRTRSSKQYDSPCRNSGG